MEIIVYVDFLVIFMYTILFGILQRLTPMWYFIYTLNIDSFAMCLFIKMKDNMIGRPMHDI